MTPWKLHRAVRTLSIGGIIAYPTEAVYGLGCDPFNPFAVEDLLRLKQRPMDKGLIIIAASIKQLETFITLPSARQLQTIKSSWPGPVTWLLPARHDVPVWLTGQYQNIAVRVTAHRQTAQLCHAFGGGLVSTSANLPGHPPARHSWQVHNHFADSVDMIIGGATGGQRRPSEIRDATTGNIVRPG
ncbi:MAG: Sua5/YciO/YrdC/YwlC family protein [Gammaproteobacteria bacterium]|nr:MAG: Sua5/YciO/YrdC/YwlC family protein [Gammaproteobacteria bacterium]